MSFVFDHRAQDSNIVKNTNKKYGEVGGDTGQDWLRCGRSAKKRCMKPDIASLTLRALRRVLRATEIGSRQLAIATGLTTSQWLVLREINARERTTPGTIAQVLQFSQPTVTTIVDRLVALELVQRQRSTKDKRQFLLSAMPAGKEVVANAPDLLQMTFTNRFIELPHWEQAMIFAAVERLAMLLDAQDIDAAPLLDSRAIDRSEPN